MPNIFAGIRKISDTELRQEIALLENISIGNAMKETGSKALGKLAAFAGNLGKQLGLAPEGGSSNDRDNKSPADILGQVEKRCVALSGLSRMDLEVKFKTILEDKCREFMSAGQYSEVAVTEDYLSVIVIRESAKIYDTDGYLPPAVQAEAVYNAYEEALLKSILKIVKSESKEDALHRDILLQQALNAAPIESKRFMQKRLVLEEFSGRGLGKVIRASATTKRLKIIVECIGLGAFPLLQAYIDTAFDTMFGIHRLKRAVFCHLVWRAVYAMDGVFAVKSDVLPSFQAADVRNATSQDEKAFMKQVAARNELEAMWNKARLQVERYENELSDIMENMTMEEVQAETEPPRVTQVKNNLDFARKQYAEHEKEYMGLREVVAQAASEKAWQLQVAWQAFYPRFVFEESVYVQAVEKYTKTELVNLERMLKEMHDCIDISAYSNKKIKQDEIERDCVICRVSDGRTACIVYSGSQIYEV